MIFFIGEKRKKKEDSPEPAGERKTIRFANDSSDSENEKEKVGSPPPAKKPTTLQQKMLAMAGQDIDMFMKEVRSNNYEIILHLCTVLRVGVPF